MFRTRAAAFFLVVLTAPHVQAETADATTVFSSGEKRVALIELFTSEGCSSCPPADRWLSGLATDDGLWTRFVPVAFHVDYWDYIGWKDRFAQAEFSARQREYAELGAAPFVYTPGVFYHGKDWRGWRNGGSVNVDGSRVGDLTVRVENRRATIRFDSAEQVSGPLTAHVALLGMQLETAVRAGENKGRTLKHDFVVLDVVATRLQASDSGLTATATLPDNATGVSDLALAVWVSADGSQAPIQSVGGFLPAS